MACSNEDKALTKNLHQFKNTFHWRYWRNFRR